MAGGSRPARAQPCLRPACCPAPGTEPQPPRAPAAGEGTRRDLPAQRPPARTVPARLGRGRVGFPPRPSTGAVRDVWRGVSLCDGPPCREGRSCSRRAREPRWHRGAGRGGTHDCRPAPPRVAGLVVKQKAFNGSFPESYLNFTMQ